MKIGTDGHKPTTPKPAVPGDQSNNNHLALRLNCAEFFVAIYPSINFAQNYAALAGRPKSQASHLIKGV